MPKLGIDNYSWTISRNNTYPPLLSLVIKSRSASLTNRSWTLTANRSRIFINFHKINHFQKKWVKPHNYNSTRLVNSREHGWDSGPCSIPYIVSADLGWCVPKRAGHSYVVGRSAIWYQMTQEIQKYNLFLSCSLGNTQSKINSRNNMYKSI